MPSACTATHTCHLPPATCHTIIYPWSTQFGAQHTDKHSNRRTRQLDNLPHHLLRPPRWPRRRRSQPRHSGNSSSPSSSCSVHRSLLIPGMLSATSQMARSRPTILHAQPAEALAVRKTGIACQMECASRGIDTTSATRVRTKAG